MATSLEVVSKYNNTFTHAISSIWHIILALVHHPGRPSSSLQHQLMSSLWGDGCLFSTSDKIAHLIPLSKLYQGTSITTWHLFVWDLVFSILLWSSGIKARLTLYLLCLTQGLVFRKYQVNICGINKQKHNSFSQFPVIYLRTTLSDTLENYFHCLRFCNNSDILSITLINHNNFEIISLCKYSGSHP